MPGPAFSRRATRVWDSASSPRRIISSVKPCSRPTSARGGATKVPRPGAVQQSLGDQGVDRLPHGHPGYAKALDQFALGRGGRAGGGAGQDSADTPGWRRASASPSSRQDVVHPLTLGLVWSRRPRLGKDLLRRRVRLNAESNVCSIGAIGCPRGLPGDSLRRRGGLPGRPGRRPRADRPGPRRLGRLPAQLAARRRRRLRLPGRRRPVAGRAARSCSRVVDVPRLVHTYGVGEPLPHPALEDARSALSSHYLPVLGEPFVTAGCCFYRDGRDGVAWHGDTIGRGKTRDTLVAIVSLGDPRRLALRPRGGGESLSFARARRPAGDGWLLPADVGARRTQGGPRGAADLGAVPPAQRVLT